jgi:hypothetical protein
MDCSKIPAQQFQMAADGPYWLVDILWLVAFLEVIIPGCKGNRRRNLIFKIA